MVACIAALLLAHPAWGKGRYVVDRSFGHRGVVWAGMGPVAEQDSVSSQALARDRHGRLVVGVANGYVWQVRRYLPGGRLDRSFGDDGLVVVDRWGWITSDRELTASLTQLAVRPDGRILLVGFIGGSSEMMVMAQLLPDGSPDLSFGVENGSLPYGGPMGAVAVGLLRDGGFVVGGFTKVSVDVTGGNAAGALWRFTSDGKRDKSFARGGRRFVPTRKGKSSYVLDLEVLPDGRIVAGTTYKGRYMVMRLRRDGSYDRSFGRNGRVVIEVGSKGCACELGRALEVDRRGRVLLTGYGVPPAWERPGFGATIRLTRRGRLDRSWGRRGIVRFVRGRWTQFHDIALDRRGGVWVTGMTGRELGQVPNLDKARMITLRYRPNGRLDRRFFRKGRLLGVRKQSAGWRVLAAGRSVHLSGRRIRHGKEKMFIRKFTWRR